MILHVMSFAGSGIPASKDQYCFICSLPWNLCTGCWVQQQEGFMHEKESTCNQILTSESRRWGLEILLMAFWSRRRSGIWLQCKHLLFGNWCYLCFGFVCNSFGIVNWVHRYWHH